MPSCKGLFTRNVPICDFLQHFARFCNILSTRIWRLFSLSPPCESPSCVTSRENPSACLTLFQRLFSKQATCQSESQALTFLELFYEKPLQLCQSASKQAVKDQRLQKPIQAANFKKKHIHGQIVVSSHMLSFWQKFGLKRKKRHLLLETALCGTPEQIFGSQQLSFEFNPLWDFFLFENFLRHLGTIVGKYAW